MRPEIDLTAVMYHYVRDPRRNEFPALRALSLDAFVTQVQHLRSRFEMATLETALAFLEGRYDPVRPLCLLTFDDGLKEHYTTVLPVLHDLGVEGLFFIPTGCIEGRVASVHKNHFLLASLGLDRYRRAFLDQLSRSSPATPTEVDAAKAQQYYRFDTPEVAAFKYLVAVGLSNELRAEVLDGVFAAFLGDEASFARELYLSWAEARALQEAGMVLGGHSHLHAVLRGLSGEAQRADLAGCAAMMHQRLHEQPVWPFSYPYGEYDDVTIDVLREVGFQCAFTVSVGTNPASQDPYQLRRLDTNDVGAPAQPLACAL
jgi:peptidoglycan/xylan/chitin deacetylase (PgdA/CDA1 family)